MDAPVESTTQVQNKDDADEHIPEPLTESAKVVKEATEQAHLAETKVQEVLRILSEEKARHERGFKEREEAFERRLEKLQTEMQSIEEHKVKREGLLKINVGGHRFMTSKTTIDAVPETVLTKLFSGFRIDTDDEDFVFIDRDGTHFEHILNYLRNKCEGRDYAAPLPLDRDIRRAIATEAEYYGLTEFADLLNSKVRGSVSRNKDITVREFFDKYAAGCRNFAGLTFHECDFSGMEFEHVNFRRTNMTAVEFDRAVLSTCDFKGATLSNVDFSDASLSTCNFTTCTMTDVTFSRADITSSSFSGAGLTGVAFEETKFNESVEFPLTVMHNVVFTGASFADCTFEGCQIDGFDFADVRIARPASNRHKHNFQGAVFKNGTFARSSFESFNFYKAVVVSVSMEGAVANACIDKNGQSHTYVVLSQALINFLYTE